ncbi:MAG: pilin [Candidatus Peribacteraceae bacterium]|nr:pilin [Candidatus Peribacteraceae bacterium]
MSHKIKALTLGLAALVGVSTFATVTAPSVAAADDINKTCTQWQIDQGICTPGLRDLVLSILNWFMFFLGLVATGFLVYGGFLYITSAGSDENVKQAKKIIIYAAVGIIVIILSAVLVNALVNMLAPGSADSPGV